MDRISRQRTNEETADLSYCKPNGHTQKSRIRMLLEGTWNIFYDWPCAGPQHLAKSRRLNSYQATSLTTAARNKKSTAEGKRKIHECTWELGSTLLSSQRVKPEIEGELKKGLVTNESGNTTYQKVRNSAEAFPRGRFTATKTYVKKQGRPQ